MQSTLDKLNKIIINSCTVISPADFDIEKVKLPDSTFVDMHYFTLYIDTLLANECKEELISLIKTIPEMTRDSEIGYIELGGILGSQQLALCLLGLGKSLGLWNLWTPKAMFQLLGIGEDTELMEVAARSGLITKQGFAV